MKNINKKYFSIILGILLCMIFGLSACDNTSVKEEVEEAKNSIIIYDENDITISLLLCKNPSSGADLYILDSISHGEDEELWVELSNILVNEEYNISPISLSLKKDEANRQSINGMAHCVAYLESGKIENISIHMKISNGDTYEVMEEKDLSLTIPENMVSEIVCEPFFGAIAKEQVLIDREDLRVTLMKSGHYISDDFYSNSLNVKLLFENKSKKRIPIAVSAANINGYTVDISGYGQYLEPDRNQFVDLDIREFYYGDLDIKKMTSLELMILTDEKERDDYYSIEGGSWYPVELTLDDTEVLEEDQERELIYSSNDIELYYLGQEYNSYSYTDDEEGYYTWNFEIVNNSDDDISLTAIEKELNGVSEDEMGDDQEKSYGMIGESVGAKAKAVCKLQYNFKNKEPRPILSFKIMIKSLTGGSLIEKGTKRIRIQPRPEVVEDDSY